METNQEIKARLEYLRGEINEERISYEGIAELMSLIPYIDKDDVQLLQWAGVEEDGTYETQIPASELRVGDLVDLMDTVPYTEYDDFEYDIVLSVEEFHLQDGGIEILFETDKAFFQLPRDGVLTVRRNINTSKHPLTNQDS